MKADRALSSKCLSTEMFQPLLVPIVTRRAQRLPIAAIPEQLHIATVRFDVINHGGECATAWPCTAVIDLKECVTGCAPLAAIAALCCGWAVSVVAFVTGTGALDLTSTQDAMRYDLATGADMRGARH